MKLRKGLIKEDTFDPTSADKLGQNSTTADTSPPRKKSKMDPRIWHKVAAISGVAAIGLGTYGAHVFKPKNPAYKEVWHTASFYHLVHSTALLAAPLVKYPNVFGGLITAGLIAFSGTCYTVAYLEDRTYSKVAPFGGFAFIGAWASLLF